MKKFLFITGFVLFLFTSKMISAQGAYAYLDINNIRARISANGHHFWDMMSSPNFEVPKSSQKHTIFCNTLWIGGLDVSNNLYLSAERYRQVGADYTNGPLTDDGTATTDQQTIDFYDRLWIVDRYVIETHILWALDPSSYPGYVIPNSILEWPAHGDTSQNQSFYLAPFIDFNGNGIYDPVNGDYPRIRGDRSIFFIFNDSGIPNTESGGVPLGIEVHGMAYAFYCPSSYAFDHTIFMHYKIINRSTRNYYHTEIGLFADFDIGYAYDDFIGCDVSRGSIFAYNGVSLDGSGGLSHYGVNPPAQSLTILAGPYMDADGIDNPSGLCDEGINGFNFGNGIADDERLGMTTSIYFNNTGATQWYMSDPANAADYYNYLRGYWKDSTKMLYGGNGHLDSGAYGPECNFMFPGDTDPCNWGTGALLPNGPVYWTEEVAGNSPYDRRGIASSGSFTFLVGSIHEIDFAFVYGRGSNGVQSSIDKLKSNIDSVRYYFVNNMTPCGVPFIDYTAVASLPDKIMLNIYPNPANDVITCETDFHYNLQYSIFDGYGKLLLEGISHNNRFFHIDISKLTPGIYILRMNNMKSIATYKFMKL
jgi:hypothetical protein